MNFQKVGNIWKSVAGYYEKSNNGWVQVTEASFINRLESDDLLVYGGSIDSAYQFLTIGGSPIIEGESGSFTAICDNVVNVTAEATWTIVSGSAYGTIAPGGFVTLNPEASGSNMTIQAVFGNLTATKDITVTYRTGSASQTETEIVVDPVTGNTTTTTTTTTVNEDGSTSSETTSTTYDSNGDPVGSSENTTVVNADGSSTSTTTNYNADGDPTTGTNVATDTSGNINTQQVEYDENGDTTVTGYTIDTSNNPNGTESFNGDGVNTEYYAFDLTHGFVIDYHFKVDCSNKPAGQNENHHNILTMKRATPSPWYGFQLRQTGTTKSIILGTQFETGSNTNTTLQPLSLNGNIAEYNLKIIYDPTIAADNFKCINAATGAVLFNASKKFPDLPELRYLKVTLGYAMDENGDPYRFSDLDVLSFSIRRLNSVDDPAISCNGKAVTITCPTAGAVIYYRLNSAGAFAQYTGSITISADTVVEAYAELEEKTSNLVTQTCIYVVDVEDPEIYCDGQFVTITCGTPNATIYYRLDETGNFLEYTGAIEIFADTVVEAYAELDEHVSATIREECTYEEEHDYSKDYLTFNILSDGTVNWTSVGNRQAKTIQYSLNGGAWTSITAGSETSMSVSTGDVVKFRGTNTSYATSNVVYSGFSGSTATFNIEGNAMSLIYGSSFENSNNLTGTYNFCSLFKGSGAVSAENLVLPATVLTPHCYRAMFAQCTALEVPPQLPATTLAESCYRYMFQDAIIVTAPDLLAPTLVAGCYEGMFHRCTYLTSIKCKATDISATDATKDWVQYVMTTGTFTKDVNTEWTVGQSGIPTRWVTVEEGLGKPIVVCDGLTIELSSKTTGASIYYRLNETGTYTLYSTPIPISTDTTVEAYSQLNGETSATVKEVCTYDDGITEPVIYCDGEYVTISCDTGGASIYYRLDQTGTFQIYTDAIVIMQDTYVEAYSEIDGRRSETVSQNCIYDESLKAPVIACDGTEVTITCHTAGADIYYRLGQEGTYTLYTAPIAITEDTVVEAYSELDGETSQVVTKTCIYDDTHDYSKDYLTLVATSGGTIAWHATGSGQAKTIQYSLNDGAWTPITAGSSSTISVSTGDTVRLKGTNTSYAKDKNNYSGFDGGTATFDIEGNIMSLVYGDNFENQTTLTGTYNFCSLFKLANCVSAENLILPSTTLTNYCYRAMFSKCPDLISPPALPATTLAQGCYWYMFEECPITSAPDLLADELVRECYGYMFTGCRSLNYIKCMATTGFSTSQCKVNWTQNVASSGTFVKDSSVTTTTWSRGASGIPTNWLVYDGVSVSAPVITCDGYNNVTITCDTQGATIYYRLNETGNYIVYTSPLEIAADTVVEAYADLNGQESRVVSQTCQYISDDPYEASNRNLYKWNYNNTEVTTPYSVNQLDGHSSNYAKGTFNFETSFALRQAQPAYLWFQHADQSATVYIDDVMVEKHWGGYTAFFVDISNHVHAGTNKVKVALKNNEGNYLAPAAGDFNFNATLGNVKLFTSPYLPGMNYGYDGFHVTSTVTAASATINIRTTIPVGASVVCTITDGTYNYTDTQNSTGEEMTFSTTITNPHLWNGTLDPYLYTITLEIYHDNELYHRYVRPYGLRFYEYVINDTVKYGTAENPYTGFLLNGSPYLLRGVCMHDDIDGKANALNDADYTQTFSIIQELGCNFIRLAHYPHPKETYDWCDRLGIVVQTEGPCVNKMQSTMPTDYYDHLNTQYDDMVNQHYNHPCIMFWGLSNETTTDDKAFANTKINGYISRIKALDSERLVGYVMAQSASDPSAYYNDPNADWFGCNLYEGWYSNTSSNNPSSAINTRIRNIITNKSKVMAYSEYGCGGTQHCHSDDFMTTTTRGNNPRHDIEYMMWLHEGHIAAIKNYPQLLFTAQWQLFDIAVANRNEGYTVCLDGENTTTDDSLRRLNDKGLVERDHVTKKDPFYLYKAWWSTQRFVHICGKDYQKTVDRAIKCYTNDGNSLSLYVNGLLIDVATVTDNIATFTAMTFSAGDVVRVEGERTSDTVTF